MDSTPMKKLTTFFIAGLLLAFPILSITSATETMWKYAVKTKHYTVYCNISKEFTQEAADMAEAAFTAASKLLDRTNRDPRFIKTIENNFPKKAKLIKETEDGNQIYEMPDGITIEKWWLFMTRYDIKMPDGRVFTFLDTAREGKKVKIYLYNNQEDYKKDDAMNTLGISTGEGGWSPGEGKIAFGLIEGQGYINLNILIHEIMHQVITYVLFNEPTWLDEGLAEYAAISDQGKYSPGVIRYNHIRTCYNAILAGKFIPARKIISMDSTNFHCKDKQTEILHYAESWALVNFLVLSEQPQIKGKFPKYFVELRKGNDPIKSFKKIYDIKVVERELVKAITTVATTPAW